MMALHSRKAFDSWRPAGFDGEFDWDFLLPAFMGTNVKPMDCDAQIERRGHFLNYETKKPGIAMDKGQRITLTRRWEQGHDTIFQVEGKNPANIIGMAIYWEGEYDREIEVGNREFRPCDWRDVLYMTRRWFCWASDIDIPNRDDWEMAQTLQHEWREYGQRARDSYHGKTNRL